MAARKGDERMLTITLAEGGRLCEEYTENPIVIGDPRMESDVLSMVRELLRLSEEDRALLLRLARRCR